MKFNFLFKKEKYFTGNIGPPNNVFLLIQLPSMYVFFFNSFFFF